MSLLFLILPCTFRVDFSKISVSWAELMTWLPSSTTAIYITGQTFVNCRFLSYGLSLIMIRCYLEFMHDNMYKRRGFPLETLYSPSISEDLVSLRYFSRVLSRSSVGYIYEWQGDTCMSRILLDCE